MDAPVFHDASGSIRFWVVRGETSIGASISKETLSYYFKGRVSDDSPMAIYTNNRDQIHTAVRLKASAGAIEPIMLRPADLAAAKPV